MAKILTLKPKPKHPYPLIEIMGPLDIGKTPVAKLVARRLSSTSIPFPVLDPSSLTGRGLLTSLASVSKELESTPDWWAHIYAANLYEQVEKIEYALMLGPVVVTNYVMAYRIWMKALGVDISNFTRNIPEPSVAYLLKGDPIVPIARPKFQLSIELILKIQRLMNFSIDSRVRKVSLSDFQHKFTHIHVNNICMSITSDLKERFGCWVDERELYTLDSFLKKKDV